MNAAKIDLEKLARDIGWMEKHADYILITQDTIAIIEETKTAKKDDIEKLEKTIEAIRNGPLKNHIPTQPTTKIIAIIHAERKVDLMITRLILTHNHKNTIYHKANCNQELKKILNQHGLDP